ncbi:hypothetical protein BD626DRAFT_629985 [Schizophyllum amplum]|uniref:Uncharacterized protein n=1 Tax=Schizophyllum amplum TaxID=97359 RepID=A0A550CF70_9AGAR|nr:hypothetical protein BD626DRAFT_629985 [Auriculariopsis ampla]
MSISSISLTALSFSKSLTDIPLVQHTLLALDDDEDYQQLWTLEWNWGFKRGELPHRSHLNRLELRSDMLESYQNKGWMLSPTQETLQAMVKVLSHNSRADASSRKTLGEGFFKAEYEYDIKAIQLHDPSEQRAIYATLQDGTSRAFAYPYEDLPKVKSQAHPLFVIFVADYLLMHAIPFDYFCYTRVFRRPIIDLTRVWQRRPPIDFIYGPDIPKEHRHPRSMCGSDLQATADSSSVVSSSADLTKRTDTTIAPNPQKESLAEVSIFVAHNWASIPGSQCTPSAVALGKRKRGAEPDLEGAACRLSSDTLARIPQCEPDANQRIHIWMDKQATHADNQECRSPDATLEAAVALARYTEEASRDPEEVLCAMKRLPTGIVPHGQMRDTSRYSSNTWAHQEKCPSEGFARTTWMSGMTCSKHLLFQVDSLNIYAPLISHPATAANIAYIIGFSVRSASHRRAAGASAERAQAQSRGGLDRNRGSETQERESQEKRRYCALRPHPPPSMTWTLTPPSNPEPPTTAALREAAAILIATLALASTLVQILASTLTLASPITRIALTDDPGVLPVVLLSLAFPHVGMRYGAYQVNHHLDRYHSQNITVRYNDKESRINRDTTTGKYHCPCGAIQHARRSGLVLRRLCARKVHPPPDTNVCEEAATDDESYGDHNKGQRPSSRKRKAASGAGAPSSLSAPGRMLASSASSRETRALPQRRIRHVRSPSGSSDDEDLDVVVVIKRPPPPLPVRRGSAPAAHKTPTTAQRNGSHAPAAAQHVLDGDEDEQAEDDPSGMDPATTVDIQDHELDRVIKEEEQRNAQLKRKYYEVLKEQSETLKKKIRMAKKE